MRNLKSTEKITILFNTGKGIVAEKYYAKANRFYSILYWAYLGLSIMTLATMVSPAVIVTIHNYFTSEEMTPDQWSIPFYIA